MTLPEDVRKVLERADSMESRARAFGSERLARYVVDAAEALKSYAIRAVEAEAEVEKIRAEAVWLRNFPIVVKAGALSVERLRGLSNGSAGSLIQGAAAAIIVSQLDELATLRAAHQKAVEAEREACARTAVIAYQDPGWHDYYHAASDYIAGRIRSRSSGETEATDG